MRERERGRDIQRQTEKRNFQTKRNKSQKRYLPYIRGRQNHPISQKMKNLVFSDNIHQIIYIIPAPSTPAPRPLYPRPLYPRPRPRPLYPRMPAPLSTRPNDCFVIFQFFLVICTFVASLNIHVVHVATSGKNK